MFSIRIYCDEIITIAYIAPPVVVDSICGSLVKTVSFVVDFYSDLEVLS